MEFEHPRFDVDVVEPDTDVDLPDTEIALQLQRLMDSTRQEIICNIGGRTSPDRPRKPEKNA